MCCGYSVSGGNENWRIEDQIMVAGCVVGTMCVGEMKTKREGSSQFYNFARDINIKWFKIPLSTRGLCVHHIFMSSGYSLGSSVGD